MYILKRDKKKSNFKSMSKIDGLSVKTKKGKTTIVSDYLKNLYAKRMINKKLKSCYKKIYNFLTSDDDSEAGVKVCLGEIERLKSSVFLKYKEFLKDKEYKEFLAKIVITENEFKNKYHEREYFARMIDNLYRNMNITEEIKSSKSR